VIREGKPVEQEWSVVRQVIVKMQVLYTVLLLTAVTVTFQQLLPFMSSPTTGGRGIMYSGHLSVHLLSVNNSRDVISLYIEISETCHQYSSCDQTS